MNEFFLSFYSILRLSKKKLPTEPCIIGKMYEKSSRICFLRFGISLEIEEAFKFNLLTNHKYLEFVFTPIM